MLLQELWLHKLNWDDPLPINITSKWLAIKEDLSGLAKLSIPRWLNTSRDSRVTIHGFSDASQFAMAAVIYITVHSPPTGVVTSLVCSKIKVAPLKRLTIPRLELTAALLLAKLTKYVQDTLKVEIEEIHLWTDSQVALTWIKTHASHWKDYVRNRVSQIQELTPTAHWKHVPGASNPADCASRGLTTVQLATHSLWWTGPPWMSQPVDSWPLQLNEPDSSSTLELRPGVSLVAAAPKIDYHWDLVYRYSSLNKLLRLTSICFKIASRLRKVPGSTPVSHVSSVDMEKARIFWIKATQSTYFSHELKMLTSNRPLAASHAFSHLTAFIDAQGVIRVGGRLHHSDFSFEIKHPAILPRHSQLSTLIIDHAHKRTLHGGTQTTLAFIRQTYWIIGGRQPVRSYILRCVTCARQRGIRAQQLMGQLPLCRVTPSRPFSHTGIDYAGPLIIKAWKGRGSKTHKGWICVFVCLTTSAVHLELVSDYSTAGFIVAYRRFTSRRGIPHTLYSDCGTNFQGAEAELRKMLTQGTREHQVISSVLAQDHAQWSFNPPAAPHMRGKWEAVVKSV
ncbi:hypothetical protein KPH14_012848, partial [Odynerus spinipes]